MSYLWLKWNKNAGRLLFWTTVTRRTVRTTRTSCPNPRMETVRPVFIINLYSLLNVPLWPIYFSFQIRRVFSLIVANAPSFFVRLWLFNHFMQNFIPSVFPCPRICKCVWTLCALTESQSVCICVCLSGYICMFFVKRIEDLNATRLTPCTTMEVRKQGKG